MKYILTIIVLLIGMSASLLAQESELAFIDKADAFFRQNVKQGKLDYNDLYGNAQLSALVSDIASADVSDMSDAMEQAFLINAYNLLVISQVVDNYPVSSVQDVVGFFDKKNSTLGGNSVSLNEIEKKLLIKKYQDPRFHFVLVCGAVGCPPITDFAYHPDRLEQQLNEQTRSALNDKSFLSSDEKTINLSKIFSWYNKDFGGNKKAVISFINDYIEAPLSDTKKLNYVAYDWTLNDANIITPSTGGIEAKNSLRYVVSSTIPKGTTETKIFNNLYTQSSGSPGDLRDRSTFFTTTITSLYGLSNRLNVGINTRYRRVRNERLPSSPFSALGSSDGADSARSGVTAFGPMIRFAPVPKWENFSIQSSFTFAIGEDLTGSSTQPFIDWDGPTWWTQFFNDIAIGNSFSLFTEIDLLIEDIGSGNVNRFSTPVVLIFSYNPIANMTLYTLGGYSPFWQADFDYFTQFGLGFKYQFTPKFELELLYTDFSNQFLNDTGGQAATYNLGFRFNI